MSSQVWWFTARSSGIVTWVLVSASVLWGLALSTKIFGRRPRPNWLLDLHRFLGGAAVVFLVLHVMSIVADTYVHFGMVEVLVPLTGTWHPVAVAWGIVGFYLLLAVQITSLLRRRLSKRVWRATHLLSFPLFVVTTIHVLTAGTDRTNPAMRIALLGVTLAVAVMTTVRANEWPSDVGGRPGDIAGDAIDARSAMPPEGGRVHRLPG